MASAVSGRVRGYCPPILCIQSKSLSRKCADAGDFSTCGRCGLTWCSRHYRAEGEKECQTAAEKSIKAWRSDVSSLPFAAGQMTVHGGGSAAPLRWS
jgi:hypothetical protein